MTVAFDDGAPSATARETSRELTREVLFAVVVLAAILNAASTRIFGAIARDGLAGALANTFDESAIVWLATAVGVLTLIRTGAGRPPTRADLVVMAVASLLVILPVPWFSQFAVAVLGVHLVLSSRAGEPGRDAGLIVLALSIPLLWARVLLAGFTDAVLRLDALVVGLLAGEAPVGNAVPFPDGSGVMFIGPACSSLTNMSLAVVAVAMIAALYRARWGPALMLWAAIAAGAVFVINVVRMGLIAHFPDRYDTLHGPAGAILTNWLTVAVVLAIAIHGVGRHAARAR